MTFRATEETITGLRALWSLSEDALVETNSTTDRLVLLSRWGEEAIEDRDGVLNGLLKRMGMGPIALAHAVPPDASTAPLAAALDRIGHCVVRSLGSRHNGDLVLSVAPTHRDSRLRIEPVRPTTTVRLSRFAAMRACAGVMRLESPLAQHRVELHDPLAVWVAGSVSTPTTVAQLTRRVHGDHAAVADIVAYLVAARMMLSAGEVAPGAARFAEDDDPDLMYWPYHELMFHARTRHGRQDSPLAVGAAYRDRLTPLPVVKPVPSGQHVRLRRPNLSDLAATDPPLTQVVEAPPAAADAAAADLSVDQVGELLYRTARVRSRTAVAEGAVTYEVSDRPYPSSFGLYELELYLAVHQCAGLARGIYHYDPSAHALTRIDYDAEQFEERLDDARVAAGVPGRPAVLIFVTARIGRLARQFCSVAYATTLRHAGLLQATLHLVATAMRMSPAVASLGDGEMSSRVLGLDWPAEVNVGEFLVGVPGRQSTGPLGD